jgi:shikimate kinase
MASHVFRPIERVALLGYMRSGKSTVAESLARRLDWRHLDFDSEIERREGRPIAEIVEARGEEYLRSLEAALTQEISGERCLVLAPGGGWITRPELLRAIRPGTFAAWLSVSAEETVRRLIADREDRPFKDHPAPMEAVAEMLREREHLYRLADVRVPGDGRRIEEIAFEIEQIVRTRGILTYGD